MRCSQAVPSRTVVWLCYARTCRPVASSASSRPPAATPATAPLAWATGSACPCRSSCRAQRSPSCSTRSVCRAPPSRSWATTGTRPTRTRARSWTAPAAPPPTSRPTRTRCSGKATPRSWTKFSTRTLAPVPSSSASAAAGCSMACSKDLSGAALASRSTPARRMGPTASARGGKRSRRAARRGSTRSRASRRRSAPSRCRRRRSRAPRRTPAACAPRSCLTPPPSAPATGCCGSSACSWSRPAAPRSPRSWAPTASPRTRSRAWSPSSSSSAAARASRRRSWRTSRPSCDRGLLGLRLGFVILGPCMRSPGV
mmetsp:Transcript_41590/g.130290  ORF Transcript_41590/g.130290 Transcript_41590/m.130290 type:complete len:313 (-) Transcript_41590:1894-2832(-)